MAVHHMLRMESLGPKLGSVLKERVQCIGLKERRAFDGLGKKELGKFFRVVIVHDPKNGSYEWSQNHYDIHERNYGLGDVIVQDQHHKTES